MLEDFITTHRLELIRRCSEKAAARNDSPTADTDLYQHGVPEFLLQLVDRLRKERAVGVGGLPQPDSALTMSAIGRSAALHGADLLLQGYDIEQVVREYGDVCQAVTSLATELDTEISAPEFRVMNRALDDAIADAVTAFSHCDHVGAQNDDPTGDRLTGLFDEHRRLIDIAIRAHSAIASGHVGMTGATGNLLIHTLRQMRESAQNAQAELGRPPDDAEPDSPVGASKRA